MPLIRLNVSETGLRTPGAASAEAVLSEALDRLPPGSPVVVMIHGYKFSPRRRQHTPHRHILALRPGIDDPRVVSWPRHLGFGKGDPNEGLAIAFGWEARRTIWQAYAEAGRAGRALAELIETIDARGARANIIAHSLGARVALAALPHLRRGAVRRAVLLSAAEFTSSAQSALDSPAGRWAEIINITSGENTLFDLLLHGFVRPHRPFDRPVGAGLGGVAPNWLDMRIDRPDTRDALAGLGFRIPAPERRVCHWSGYLRPGMFALHRALIRQPERTAIARLRAVLPDVSVSGPFRPQRNTGLPLPSEPIAPL